jgi:hypothetical protein
MQHIGRLSILILLASIFLIAGCAPQPTPTPFRPPTYIPPTKPLPTLTPIPAVYNPAPTVTLTPTTTAGPCTNDLQFISDLTVDDGTVVSPGSSIDKQWLVQNTGTCDWDSTYRLKWISGDPLNAVQEQTLYPARRETQATLRILFTAPTFSGTYESWWQAMSPDGNLFGDQISIKVVVQ